MKEVCEICHMEGVWTGTQWSHAKPYSEPKHAFTLKQSDYADVLRDEPSAKHSTRIECLMEDDEYVEARYVCSCGHVGYKYRGRRCFDNADQESLWHEQNAASKLSPVPPSEGLIKEAEEKMKFDPYNVRTLNGNEAKREDAKLGPYVSGGDFKQLLAMLESKPESVNQQLLWALENLLALVQGEMPSLLEDDHHYGMCVEAIERAKSVSPVEATGPACMDCDRPYPYGLDTVLTRKQWLMIAPGDGLLCASCIVDRAKKLPGSIAVYAHIVLNEHYDKEDSLENILIALRLENADYARENAEMKHEVEAIGSETATDSVSAEEFLKLSARLTNSKRLLERHWQLDQGCPCQLCIETREFLENES